MGNYISSAVPKQQMVHGLPKSSIGLAEGKHSRGNSSFQGPTSPPPPPTARSEHIFADQQPRAATFRLSSSGLEQLQSATLIFESLAAAREKYREKAEHIMRAQETRADLAATPGLGTVVARMDMEISAMQSSLAEIARAIQRLDQQGGGGSGNA
jgi:hypothetical protein